MLLTQDLNSTRRETIFSVDISIFNLCRSPPSDSQHSTHKIWRPRLENPLNYVTANFPLKMLSRTASIERHLKPYEVLVNLVSRFPFDNVTEELSLYVEEVDGWYNELLIHIDDDVSSVPYHSIDCIHDGDHLVIASKMDNLKPRSRLSSLALQFKSNPILKNKLLSLGPTHAGWRALLADGNSFYRAVYYGLFEHLLASDQREAFFDILDKFKSLGITTAAHVGLCSLLEEVAHGRRWKFLQDFEMDVASSVRSACKANTDPDDDGIDEALPEDEMTIDKACIAACRELLAQYVLNHEKHDYFGIPLKNALLSQNPSVKNLKDYCERFVTKMGVEPDGPLVDCGILLELFRCRGNVIYLDRREGVDITTVPMGYGDDLECASDDEMPICSIHMFHRPGHFDLLYPKFSFESASEAAITASQVSIRNSSPTRADLDEITEEFVQVRAQAQLQKKNVLGYNEILTAANLPVAPASSPYNLPDDMCSTLTDDDKVSMASFSSPRAAMRKIMMFHGPPKSMESTPKMAVLTRKSLAVSTSSPKLILRKSLDSTQSMQSAASMRSSPRGYIWRPNTPTLDDDTISLLSDKAKSDSEFTMDYVFIDETTEAELSAAFFRQFTRQNSPMGCGDDIECRGGGRVMTSQHVHEEQIAHMSSDDELVMVDVPRPVSDNDLQLF